MMSGMLTNGGSCARAAGVSGSVRGSSDDLAGTDLQRFLQEVGTDAKEARYWLKHFQRAIDRQKPFAIVSVEDPVIHCPDLLQSLCSCLAFLHRHHMRVVLVHGPVGSVEDYADCRRRLNHDSMTLADALERNRTPARPLFAGSSVFRLALTNRKAPRLGEELGNGSGEAESGSGESERPMGDESTTEKSRTTYLSRVPLVDVDLTLVQWALGSGHVPIVQSIADTCGWGAGGGVGGSLGVGRDLGGGLAPVERVAAAAALAERLEPLKVLMVNESGGLHDETGQVIPIVRLPGDLASILSRPWLTAETKQKVADIAELVSHLPAQSSVVIVAAARLLLELFTHRGSGTFFKLTEGISVFSDLSEVAIDSIVQLIEQGFKRVLRPSYMEDLSTRLHSVYVIEGSDISADPTTSNLLTVKYDICACRYNPRASPVDGNLDPCRASLVETSRYTGAAIIMRQPDVDDVPYLDKFVVSQARQGESAGQMLWDAIRRDFPRLFWRSRKDNPINTWYFSRSEGSRCVGAWTMFWYGDMADSLCLRLIEHALAIPPSFVDLSPLLLRPLDPTYSREASAKQRTE